MTGGGGSRYTVWIEVGLDNSKVRTGQQDLDRALDQMEKNEQARGRRLSTAKARDLQRSNREQVREHERAARGAANAYERTLSQGFFAKLGRAATSGFKSGFKVGGESFGGGGLLSGIASVAGGNLLTSLVGGAVSQAKKQITDSFDFIDVTRRGELAFTKMFQNAGASAEDAAKKAKAHLAELIEFGVKSGLGEKPIALSQQLQAIGFTAEEVLPALKSVNDAVSMYPDAAERMQRVFLQLGQLKTTGQVSAEELRTLAENGVASWKYLSEYSGKSIGDLRKLAEKGMLDADVAVKVIIAGLGRAFEGQAELSAQTVTGMYDRIEAVKKQRGAEALMPEYDLWLRALKGTYYALGTEGAKEFSRGLGAQTGMLLGAAEGGLMKLISGDFGGLGAGAVNSAAEGVKSGAKGLYDAATGAAGEVEQGWRDRLEQRSPSLVMLALGFEAGASLLFGFQQGVRSEGESLRQYLERLASDPTFKAFFEAIKRVEGGAVNRIVGGRTFKDLSRHPNVVGFVGPAGPSTAAGSYQMTGTNWRDIAPKLGLKDFGAHSQLIAALELFRRRGGDKALLSGDINAATRIAAKDWAGVPGSPLPGREASLTQFNKFFQDALRGSPLPVTITNPQGGGAAASPFDARRESALEAQLKELNVERLGRAERIQLDLHKAGREAAFVRGELLKPENSPTGSNIINRRDLLNRQRELDKIMHDLTDEYHAFVTDIHARIQGVTSQLEAMRARVASDASAATGGGFYPAGDFPVLPVSKVGASGLLSSLQPGDAGADAGWLMRQQFEFLKSLGSSGDVIEAGFKQGGDAARGYFGELIKQADNSEKEMQEFAKDIAGMFGGLLQSTMRGQWRDGLRGLRDDFFSWTVGLAQDWFQSAIYKSLTGTGGGASGGGSGGGGGLIGKLVGGVKNLFGFGGPSLTGGFSGGNPAASILFPSSGITSQGLFGSLSPGGIGIPTSGTQLKSIANIVGGSGQGAGGALSAGVGGAGKFGMGSLAGVAAMAPLLGAGLGASLGGGSIGGQVLGGVGGLLGGLGAAAIFAPSSAGALGLGTVGAALGLTAASTLALTFGIGGVALAGAYLLARNKKRREDEKKRDVVSHDTGTAIWALIGRAKAGNLGVEEARTAFDEIKARYFDGISVLKDGKSKRVAQATWSHFQALWPTLEAAARESDANSKRYEGFFPTFFEGGPVRHNPLGFIQGPGTSTSDSIPAYFPAARQLARVSHTEYVLDAETTRNIGVHNLDRIRARKGLAEGGSVAAAGVSTVAAPTAPVINLGPVIVQIGKQDLTRIFVGGAQSQEGLEAMAFGIAQDIQRGGDTWQTLKRKVSGRS